MVHFKRLDLHVDLADEPDQTDRSRDPNVWAVERRAAPQRKRQWLVVGAAFLLAAAIAALLLRPRPVPTPARPAGMALVPADSYTVGGGSGRPTHSVTLTAFYIDSTEVTVASYLRYLTSVGSATPWHQQPPNEWPATGILWSEAQHFCAARGARLPTEDEWEAAARGRDGRRYPWGDQWARGRANAAGASDTLAPVGGFPLGRSFVGALDMIGNAWEWVDADTVTRGGQVRHVIKGGAFNSLQQTATTTYRVTLPDDREQLWNTGFRCAASVPRRNRD